MNSFRHTFVRYVKILTRFAVSVYRKWNSLYKHASSASLCGAYWTDVARRLYKHVVFHGQCDMLALRCPCGQSLSGRQVVMSDAGGDGN